MERSVTMLVQLVILEAVMVPLRKRGSLLRKALLLTMPTTCTSLTLGTTRFAKSFPVPWLLRMPVWRARQAAPTGLETQVAFHLHKALQLIVLQMYLWPI